jgi:hypothetical protein
MTTEPIHIPDQKAVQMIRVLVDKAGGHEAVAKRVGLAEKNARTVVNTHIRSGKLPAQWFAALEEMAKQVIPRHLFTFKGL